MSEMTSPMDAQTLARAAGVAYRHGTVLSFDDATRGRLRYALLRLSLLGLTKQDQEQLTELARLAFGGLDVATAVRKITTSADASPLAIAIAEIVEEARERESKKMAMFGAVFGAYAALDTASGPGGSDIAKAISAAIAGAVAASTSAVTQEAMATTAWHEFLQTPA